jgi:nicotinamide phosphoribosyltransferase
MDWANEYYGDPGKVKWVGGSVYATEHSIMCAGLKEHELATFQRLLQTFPEGIISIVSDTWNLWSVITEILPKLKNLILARRPTATAPGKLVIRPDSGNPVNIICGDPAAPAGSPANLGVVKLLWNEFGGTLNAKGFNELDHHIGVIYGDAITYERADEICQRLEADKFASTNVVFGIGSFTYQYVTRDTFSMAMKATAAVVDGQQLVLYKDPITDNGIKKSGRGRLAVLRDKNGELIRIDEATDAQIEHSLLRPIWSNGIPLIEDSYLEIAKRLGLRKILPEG